MTTNFRQVTHYFLRDWLPDLTPGLGFFITWARKHAQQEAHGQPIGQLRLSSWDVPAKAIGVAPYSVKRWVKDQGSYPHTRAFIRSVKEEYGGYGQVEEMQADSWTIGGQQVLITAESRIRDPVFVGDTVKLVATKRDDHGSHVPLVAQSLEIAMDARRPLGLSLRAFVLDVRISEPIHPADRRRYAKLRNLFGEDQSNGHTKADKTSTRSDKPRTRSDSRFTRDDTTRTKDNKRYAKTDKPQAGSDKGRTESDALRDSQKDSKDKVKKNKQLPQEARIPPQAEPHSRRRPSLA
ncbi:MAG: hypothetical protein GTO53_06215, partial [Planctomycetales bacterium]|nr:hypothetical protein [Planctomycetales bacterium]